MLQVPVDFVVVNIASGINIVPYVNYVAYNREAVELSQEDVNKNELDQLNRIVKQKQLIEDMNKKKKSLLAEVHLKTKMALNNFSAFAMCHTPSNSVV